MDKATIYDIYGYIVDPGNMSRKEMERHNCAVSMDIADMQCQCGQHLTECSVCGDSYLYQPRDPNSLSNVCPACDRINMDIGRYCVDCKDRNTSSAGCNIFTTCPKID